MRDTRLVGLSKRMSLILRHDPERNGLVLDGEGFVPVQELLAVLQREQAGVTESDLRLVVETVEPEKQRFSMVEGEIRANYGHSIAGKITQELGIPPEVLFHGTTDKTVPLILSQGLKPMGRQYVHLTPDKNLALKVGARRGKPRLLAVQARRAHDDGLEFYKANRSFWLTNEVPARYLSEGKTDPE